MDISIFMNKTSIPETEELRSALGLHYNLWLEIRNYTFEKYPSATEEWNFPGKNYGWSFRIKDKKRAIIYLLPRDGYFKVAFVFGEKACKQVFESSVDEAIKQQLAEAKPYAEGRGIRIDIRDRNLLEDTKKLIEIKLAN